MKWLINCLLVISCNYPGSWNGPISAQTIKGHSIQTHSISLEKKIVKNTDSDSIPLIGFASPYPYLESSTAIKCAFDHLTTEKGFKVEYVSFKNLIKHGKSINRYSVLWIHRPDTTDLSDEETNPKIIIALQSFLEHGGKLLLTQQAFHYINNLGLESEIPKDSTKRCIDDGYGRKLGFHAFRDHPLFNQMNGGAYILRPQRDMTTRISGFFGNNVPKVGKVVAVDWDYIFVREDSKLIAEYTTGTGKVIAVGAYIDFTEVNLNRSHLELFIRNVFNYLTGKYEGTKKWYWDYSPNIILEDKRLQISSPIKNPSPRKGYWKDTNDEMTIKKRFASLNYFDIAGERLLTMGSENGGIEEVWAHPFMAFKDYEVGIKFSYRDTIYWLNDERPELEVHPGYLLRQYRFPRAYLKEIIVNDPVNPAGVIHYEYNGVYEAEMIIRFKTNFRWMWPYSQKVTGSINHSWDTVLNAFIFQDKSKDINLILGSSRKPLEQISGQFEGFKDGISGQKISAIPTSTFQAAALLRYSIAATDILDIIYSATNEGFSKTVDTYCESIADPHQVFDNSIKSVEKLLSSRLMITTPDLNFNKGYRWALIGANRFMVNTPGMGRSLVAGYSTTRHGWDGGQKVSGRPGYGWYFGRDGEWSGLALTDLGDFDKVKSELEFYNKYQDLTGKIFHEATTSGFIHYDASDATPLYIVLAGKYFRFSNDTSFIRKTWPNIKKAIEFCFSTDTDKDHLIENTNVGHGWVEGGELYGSHATLYMAGCWAAALAEARNMALFVGDPESGRYFSESNLIRKIINSDFWNKYTNFFSYGKNRDGSYRDDPTILPAVPLSFGLAEKEKADLILKQYASNTFTTNWGTRIIRDDSPYFNPRGYHYGSVWPLFTGWCSLAEFAYGNQQQGFSHLMNNLNVYKYWGLGFVEEVLNGSEYQPSGVCPHQCWSETMVLQPAIEGLLGLDVFSQENKVHFSPRIPANWDSMKVENIRIANRWCNYKYYREKGINHFLFTLVTGSPITFDFMPFFPAGTIFRKVTLNGDDIPFTSFSTQKSTTLLIQFELKEKSQLEIQVDKGISIIPVISDPKPGYPAAGLRILSTKLVGKEYVIELEGSGRTSEMIQVYCHHQEIERIENGKLIRQSGPILDIAIDFQSNGRKYSQKTVKIIFK